MSVYINVLTGATGDFDDVVNDGFTYLNEETGDEGESIDLTFFDEVPAGFSEWNAAERANYAYSHGNVVPE